MALKIGGMCMSSSLLIKEKKLSQFGERQHLKKPIPHPIVVKPIGKTLTEEEWNRFSKKLLNNKTAQYCNRKKDGTISFLGEGGISILGTFLDNFKERFHARLICTNVELAKEGLLLARKNGAAITEIHYKIGNKDIWLTDPTGIEQLLPQRTSASMKH